MTKKTNCQPGDLARFVGAPGMESSRGSIVRVIAEDMDDPVRHRSWLYEGNLYCRFVGGRAPSVFDSCLEPVEPRQSAKSVSALERLPFVREQSNASSSNGPRAFLSGFAGRIGR